MWSSDDDEARGERITCWFCGAFMWAREARYHPAPFSALPLPCCPDCMAVRERVQRVVRNPATSPQQQEER